MATVWRTQLANPLSVANGQYAVATDGGNEVYYAYISSGAMKFARSVNQGNSFAAEITVGSSGSIPLDVPLVKDPVTGRLWLMGADNIDSAGTAAVLKITHSDDNGVTWAAWQTLDNGTSYSNTNGRFYRVAIVAKNSIVNIISSSEDQTTFATSALALFRATNGSAASPTFTRSTPWTASSQGQPTRPVMHYDELFSTLHATWSDNGATGGAGNGGHVIVSRSTNDGSTWTTQDIAAPARLDGVHGAGRPVINASRGVVRVVCMAPFFNGSRSNLYTIRSTDDGVTWGDPVLAYTASGGSDLGHPVFACKGDYVYLVWNESFISPTLLKEGHSTDGGATWSSAVTAATYVTNTTSDAPWVLATKNMLVAFLADPSDSNKIKYTRNPAWMATPDTTRVLDNCTRANAGPPPSSSWSGASGNCLLTGAAGDGLVVASNTITQKSGGSFRQGSWWNTPLGSADHEIVVKFKQALTVSSNDGFDLYTRLQNPQVSASVHGYQLGGFEGDPMTIKRVDSAPTAVDIIPATTVGPTLAANQYMGAASVGSSHRLWFSTDGTNWELLANAEDSTYNTNGFIGLDVMNSQVPAITLLAGGTVVDPVIPTSVPPPITPAPPAVGTVIKAGGSLPDLQVLLDVTTNPTSTSRVWTDITAHLRALSYTRAGRSDELQRTQAGTLTMVADNRDAAFDPTNGAGIGIRRSQWVQVNAIWAGVAYPRWTGIILTIAQDWPDAGRDATATVQCGDAMRVLNLFPLDGHSFPAQLVSERISAIAALAGLSTNLYDASNASVPSGSPTGSAASYLATLEAEENGRVFADESGALAFQSRFYSQRHEITSPTSYVIGEATSELPYESVSIDMDDAYLYNDVTVTGGDGIAQNAADNPSKVKYFERGYSRSILGDSTEALAVAQYLVFRYREPAPRVSGVTLLPQQRTTLWPTVLGAHNGTKFTLNRRATGHTISADYYVEQIAETVVPGATWKIAMQLSPVDTGLNLWILDNATYSVLDSTTQLTY